MGLSTSLNTAIGGLNAAQVGIGVVSQNVANAETTGYVRRTVSNAQRTWSALRTPSQHASRALIRLTCS